MWEPGRALNRLRSDVWGGGVPHGQRPVVQLIEHSRVDGGQNLHAQVNVVEAVHEAVEQQP
ncbi:hypothetical protein JZ751_008701 [Albula glossodonta]|uniref:Uncharacterized protein n=1 Tax=Albula glossodonta TaxID=121402 RepID=A0A8T2PA49_9TELE|nr:hypothetical protein JZ751_008701 [Albula glossodonta]